MVTQDTFSEHALQAKTIEPKTQAETACNHPEVSHTVQGCLRNKMYK